MVSDPVFKKLQGVLKKKAFLSAIIMTLLVILVIVIPFTLLMASLANEVVGTYNSVEEMIKTGSLQAYVERLREIPVVQTIWVRLDQSFGLSQTQPFDFLLKNLQQITTFLFNQSSKILKGLSTFLFSFFFTLLSLYYLFKDGDHLFLRVKEVLPVPPKERDLLIGRFQAMVNATIFGGILIAVIQGILGGLAFWVLGLHSPVLWGTAMAFFSFIPVGGTALIWGPTCIILFIEGAFLEGIILLLIGVLVIGMVDNFLRPFFISSKTKIHPLLLFFAVLGGIQVFGLIGLVAGPLVATICLTLIEIYVQGIHSREASEIKPHK
jgi:predicted PurR-regulated permease PerM